MKRSKGIRKGRWVVRLVPLVLTLAIVAICILFMLNHDFSEILEYTPENYLLAMAVLVGFYALKSLSVVFPLTALFIAAGAVYPYWLACLVSLVGLTVCYTVPYLVGRFSGGRLVELVQERYPKARRLVELTHENDLMASYITRAIVVVPGDVVSIVHGALKMPYKPYLIGSLAGTLPQMLVQIYIGANLREMSFKTVIVFLVLTAATMLAALPFNKRFSRSAIQEDKEDFYEFDFFEEWGEDEEAQEYVAGEVK